MEDKQREFTFELIASLIIGIATVFGAWVAYQATKWSGNSSDLNLAGMTEIVQSQSMTVQGYQQYSLDMMSWIDYRKSSGTGLSASDLKNKIISPDMKKAIDWSDRVNEKVLLELNEVSKSVTPDMSDNEKSELFNGFMKKVEGIKNNVAGEVYANQSAEEADNYELQSPKTDPNYEKALFGKANETLKQAKAKFGKAQEASSNGDKYTFLSLFFTIILFFAGLSTVIKKQSLKMSFLGVGFLLLVISIIRTILLPMA